MPRSVVISVLLFLTSAAPTLPQVTVLDSAFRANSFVVGRQSDADVALAPSGELVVVWSSQEQDGDGYGVFGRRFDSLGSPIGGEFQVNTFSTGTQSMPQVAVDGSGSFLVVWLGQGASGSGVYGQRFDPSGARVAQEFLITGAASMPPAVAAGGQGDFAIASGRAVGGEILARRFDGASQSLMPEILVSAGLGSFDQNAAVGMDGAGRFVVIWSRPSDGIEYESVLRGQRFDATGQPDGPELAVSTPDPGLFLGDYDAQVAMNHDGEFVVAWERRGDGVPLQILVRPYDAQGVPKTNQLPVTPFGGGPGGLKTEPGVAMAGDGSFVMTWNGTGMRTQRFLPSGSPDGADILVDTEANCCDRDPVVAIHRSGYLAIAWFRWTTALDDVHARRLLASCAVPGVPGFDLELTTGGAGIHMTWSDVVHATDYTVFEAGSPGEPFTTETGTASNGSVGLSIPSAPGDRFYLVAGRSESCGPGPLR